MNDQLEIGGDLQDEYLEIQETEREEVLAGAPVLPPLTDEEWDEWADNGLELNPVGVTDEGVPVWVFEPDVRNMIQNTGGPCPAFKIRHITHYGMH